MKQWKRSQPWAVLAAVSLLLCAANPGFVAAGSPRKETPAFESRDGKSIRLSLKIYGAKKKKRQVSFYKSVARQARIRRTSDRDLSSGR